MARYVAFLRGVMPTNAKMPALRKAFESAGFTDVATVLGSGNVVFTARAAIESALERKAEAAMATTMGRAFYTIVRPLVALQQLIDADPYAAFRVAPNAKRVVTFSRTEHTAAASPCRSTWMGYAFWPSSGARCSRRTCRGRARRCS